MRIEFVRYGLVIIPETDQDKAFIEDTLGLKKEGDTISLVRKGDNLRTEKEGYAFIPSCWSVEEKKYDNKITYTDAPSYVSVSTEIEYCNYCGKVKGGSECQNSHP